MYDSTACGVKSARCSLCKVENYIEFQSFIGIEVKTSYFYIVFMVIEEKVIHKQKIRMIKIKTGM